MLCAIWISVVIPSVSSSFSWRNEMRLSWVMCRFYEHANVIESRKQGEMICAFKKSSLSYPTHTDTFGALNVCSAQDMKICWNVSCHMGKLWLLLTGTKRNFENRNKLTHTHTHIKQMNVDGFIILPVTSYAFSLLEITVEKNEVNTSILTTLSQALLLFCHFQWVFVICKRN